MKGGIGFRDLGLGFRDRVYRDRGKHGAGDTGNAGLTGWEVGGV